MDFTLGSELELCFKRSKFVSKETLRAIMSVNGFAVNQGGEVDKYAQWSVHGDGSIRVPNRGRNYFSAELVSPCLPAPDYFKELVKVLGFCGNAIMTNDSTGFHHGISFTDRQNNITLRNRRLLFAWLWSKRYDEAELQRWNRVGNHYCQPIHAVFEYAPRSIYDNVSAIISRPTDLGKYRSINFTKLFPTRVNPAGTNPYLEVRLMGGENYHTRFDDVLTTLSRVMEVMSDTIEGKELDEFYAFIKSHFRISQRHMDILFNYMNGDVT